MALCCNPSRPDQRPHRLDRSVHHWLASAIVVFIFASDRPRLTPVRNQLGVCCRAKLPFASKSSNDIFLWTAAGRTESLERQLFKVRFLRHAGPLSANYGRFVSNPVFAEFAFSDW
jgi:hypothetical protein